MSDRPEVCPDAICTNCGHPYRDHWHENPAYCYSNTDEDVFTTEPTEVDKLNQQIADLTAQLAAAQGKLAAIEAWAKAEQEEWREKNANRYWQMNRVVNQFKSHPTPPAPPAGEPPQNPI